MYVFRTRLPVAIKCIATPMLPLDLHVLSLPLAFILSQDQTLHCKCCLILTVISKLFLVKLRTSKLTCQIECVSLDLPIVLSSPNKDRNRIKCYCFPTFKDLLAVYCHPFLNGSAKVRAALLSPKFFSVYFQSFQYDFQIVL